MLSKIVQKFLIFFFTATFFAILIVGIGRARSGGLNKQINPIDLPTPKKASSGGLVVVKNQNQQNYKPAEDSSVPNNTTEVKTADTSQAVNSDKKYSKLPIRQREVNISQKNVVPKTQTTSTGRTYSVPWGLVTVRVVFDNNKIIGIETPDYPDSPPSQYARAYLIKQSIKENSANIQGVSGATYTSLAFQHSLESALVKSKQ